MTEIYEPTASFDFNKLVLNKPTQVSGNYFIKYSINEQSLYIQPPKSVVKQMVLNKSAKKSHCDLIFSQENEEFINWIENLESHSQKKIFENRKSWFETELEMDDIENSFTSPMKSYKSGTYYVVRTNMTPRLGKITVKVYDESEVDIPVEDISGNMTVISILEIQGIKCSAKNFQIEIELKQMMVLNPVDLFEKCIVKTKVVNRSNTTEHTLEDYSKQDILNTKERELAEKVKEKADELEIKHRNIEPVIEKEEKIPEKSNDLGNQFDRKIPESTSENLANELKEIEFNLEEIPDTETIQIKARDDVYYQMYKEARKKAKVAKDLALAAYLEARDIKNKYMLEDVSDSDSDSGSDSGSGSGSDSGSDSEELDLEGSDEQIDTE